MRYGIFSDIHGNLEALEAVITALKKDSVEMFLCGGDIVGYGANPNECIDRLIELKAVNIAGNHDWAVLGKLDVTYFNPIAKEAVVWTQKQLKTNKIKFLHELPLIFKNEDLIMVHSTLQDPESFDYLDDVEKAGEMFSLMDRRVCFVGHTHVPVILCQEFGSMRLADKLFITLASEGKYIINVGSVGQPRDGNPETMYCLFDSESQLTQIKRISYDVGSAQKKIKEAGLPQALAYRLSLGR